MSQLEQALILLRTMVPITGRGPSSRLFREVCPSLYVCGVRVCGVRVCVILFRILKKLIFCKLLSMKLLRPDLHVYMLVSMCGYLFAYFMHDWRFVL